MNKYLNAILTLLFSVFVSSSLFAGGTVRTNPPSECSAPNTKCNCPQEGVSANCIKVNIGLGETTPWTGSLGCSLKIFADDDSPSVFTPESLHAVLGGYTFKRLGQKTMSDGVTPAEVVLSHPNGEAVHFVFANGESLGRPDPGVHIKMDARLQMVDSEGWATTHDPVYYDLYVGDGTKRRFLATNMTGALGALVSITDERGVVRTPADMGVDIIYDPDGVRQYLTPTRLANVTRTADLLGYDVAVYALQEPPQKNTATGLYIVPEGQTVEHVSVRRENGGKRAVVTIRKGGGDPLRYVFDYAMGDWSLSRSSGVEEVKSRNIYDSRAAQTVTEVLSSSRTMLERTECNYKWMSWGFAMTNRVEGFGGVTDTTTWTYYTSGNGKGQVKTEKRQSGLLIQYAYDNLDRVTSESRSGPDMMTEMTTYDYSPVDPSDPVLPVDTRPRTVVRKLNNIECERTYYVYSPLTNIVERVGTQGAPYGGTNVLRTVTAFYPVAANDARSGFVASIRHEDGKLDLYDYELSSNIWVRTVTHLHEQSPAPVSGKTTRDITATNRRGETLEQKTEAFIDGIWYTIARNQMTYNFEGKRISSENLAGQVTTTAWDCCHKVSEIQPDGSTTTWDYDIEGRMIASSRLIPLDMTNVTWLTTCFRYDDLGRQVATWQTNFAAQVGLPATRTHYDALGRVVARVDQLGNTTTTSYSNNGQVQSVANPNTSTVVYERNADGDTLSITGTAVTPEFHTYGTLPDGTRWSKTVQGETASSPRFTKRYENLLGQTIREERSGFRGAVLATAHVYDALGRLVSTVADYEPTTEYTYDLLGNRIATTRLVGASLRGARDVEEAEWRKAETLSSFVLDDAIVWLTQTNIVSCSDAAIAPLVTSSARKLTGLTATLPSRSRSIDVRGNKKVIEVFYDSVFAVSCQTLPYVTNRSLAISRYGIPLMEVSVSAVTNTVAYDPLGRLAANIDGRGNARHFEYNVLGQRVATGDFLRNRSAYVYDRFGIPVAVTNAIGNVIHYEYDLRERRVHEYGATYPVRYTYDIFGNKASMMTYRNEVSDRDSGDATTWLYDEASNCMTNKIFADGKGPTYSYTPDGKLFARIWARGSITNYAYDDWGSLARILYSDDADHPIVINYNVLGRQTNVLDSAGITTFYYDDYGYLTNEIVVTVSMTNTISRYWDKYGRSLGYSLNGVRQTALGYDVATGRIESMVAIGSTNAFLWTYVPGTDLKAQLRYPNGIVTSWRYDANNHLVEVCNMQHTNIVSRFEYQYNQIGVCRSCSHSHAHFPNCDSVDSYYYDANNELTNVVSSGLADFSYNYRYDKMGNRLASTECGSEIVYAVNSLNQYARMSDSVSNFDDDGNQIRICTATGIWAILYNGENRPIMWNSANENIIMNYDYAGRRIRKNDLLFIYDDYVQIADSGGNAYVWDPTEEVLTRPLAWNMRSGRMCYFMSDGNKNVSDLIPSNGEDSIISYLYAPFGQLLSSITNMASANHFRFSCEYADDDLGLVYFNYRHYDPRTAHWLCRDTIESTPECLSYDYMYVGNQPFRYSDILGLAAAPRAKPPSSCRPPRCRPKIKPNPGNRKPKPPPKTPVVNPIVPTPAENADVIENVGNALDGICEDLDLRQPEDPQFDYQYEREEFAALDGYLQCKRIGEGHGSSAVRYNRLSAGSKKGNEKQLSAGKCKCCEVMIVKKNWCSCDSGGVGYAVGSVNFHAKSCGEVKKLSKLIPVVENGNLSYRYFDF